MTESKPPRWAMWLAGIATVLLVAGYLTAEQWLGLITRLIGA